MSEEDQEIAACLLQLANGSKPEDRDRNLDIAASEEPCSSSGGVVKDCRFECSLQEGVWITPGFRRTQGESQKCRCFCISFSHINQEDHYDSSSSYSSTYSAASALDLRLKL
ncbi:hypothetical protein HAX54_034341 [Datura stramonium]|uniref:Uncharacterized protein n=1 Tax=Datura stramonium TaxID=4076 RepID=A0ABS8SEB9_DATST|nr:hypothetical protein [Datura stramonium]